MEINKIRKILMDSRIHREVSVRFGGEGASVPLAYGTGIVGSNSPHPNAEGWKYDVNSHGIKGWWYFNEHKNKFRWTRGQSANAFMYKTYKFLEKEAPRGIVVKMNG